MEHDATLSVLHTYEEIQDRICIRVWNLEHYRRELETLAYLPWEDLAVTFFYLERGTPEAGQLPISQRDLENWKLDLYELLRQSVTQSRFLHPPIFKPMRDILQLPPDLEEDELALYVLTCEEAGYGSATMLYPGLLAEIAAEMKEDLYVLPSSVHELILLPLRQMQKPESLISIIGEVNRTVVLPGDFLSNSLYLYRRDRGELERYGMTPGSLRMMV